MLSGEKHDFDLLFAVMAVPEGRGKEIEVTYIFKGALKLHINRYV